MAGTAKFSAAARGPLAPAVQWQVSTNGGANYSNITGATSTTLTLGNVTLAQNGNRYRAVFTNSCGSAMTYGAILTVNCQTISVNPTTIPGGTTGAAYGQVFTQTGGNGTATGTDVSGYAMTTRNTPNWRAARVTAKLFPQQRLQLCGMRRWSMRTAVS